MTPDLAALVNQLKKSPHDSMCAARWPDSSVPCYCDKSIKGTAAAAIESLAAENERLLADPMNVGWQRAQDAIKDRAAAVSQWKAAKQRAERAEAECDALRKDAERLDFLLDVTTAEGEAENDPRAMAMALAFAQGFDGRAAIDAALAATHPAAPR